MHIVRTRLILLFVLAGLIVSILFGALAAAPGGDDAMKDCNEDGNACGLPLDDEKLRRTLSPEQYRIARENGTERPSANAYWDHKAEGVYVDVIGGAPLFSSRDKFNSGTGWPSFTRPIEPDALIYRADRSLGTTRIEARSRAANSHLGHLFPDGPPERGLRYCINSAALRFVPLAELDSAGFGAWRAAVTGPDAARSESVLFGAGCFWGAEAYFNRLTGVRSTAVGYAGGTTEAPTYDEVCSGGTGHAEVVLVEYDPAIVSLEQLIEQFWTIHDPTSLNRQGNDRGTQYRSAIYVVDEAAERRAVAAKERLAASGRLARPIVTEIRAAVRFHPAEEYHQRYLAKNPGGYCHINLGGTTR
jgi:peptide methionine sulfoxide reductase msrA/msrB